jgi:RNA polymerase sigma-70 factor (ECF subfamily)
MYADADFDLEINRRAGRTAQAPDEELMSAAAVAQFSLQSKTTSSSMLERWSWLAPAATRKPERLDADTSLVERCLAGEQNAWEDLIKTHTRRVYSICYRFTNRDSEAQDLTQDVFVRVFKSLGSFRSGEGSFTVWLARLTRNLLVDHGLLAGREAGEFLQAGLQKLSPELREAVILRDLEELEYKEIASVLNVPEGTVKSRLNRGRAELARILRRTVRPIRPATSSAPSDQCERTGP